MNDPLLKTQDGVAAEDTGCARWPLPARLGDERQQAVRLATGFRMPLAIFVLQM